MRAREVIVPLMNARYPIRSQLLGSYATTLTDVVSKQPLANLLR